MTIDSKIELSNCFKNLLTFQKNLLEDLNDVIIDHELIRDGWSIIFVVDYNLVHNFAFRSSEILSKYKRMPFKDQRTGIVERQAALAYLFYGLKHCNPPILLPPHILELRDKITFEHLKIIKTKQEYDAIKNWKLKLFNNDERKLMLELNKFYKKTHFECEELPDDLHKKLVDVVFDKFNDILFFTSGLSIQGINIIQKLISGEKPHLQLSSQLCRNYKELIEKIISQPNSEWYELFSKLRKLGKYTKDKSAQNYRDAKVIEIISALNDEFIRKKEKKFIYLLSAAESMKTALNPDRYPPKTIKNISYFPSSIKKHPLINQENRMYRSLNVFLLYMMAGEDSIEKTLENLKNTRSKLLTFNTTKSIIEGLIKKINRKINSFYPNQEKMYKKLKKLIEDQTKEYNEIISLSLISNRFPYLRPYINLDNSGFQIEKSIRAIALFLSGDCKELDKMVMEKEAEVKEKFEKTMWMLIENIIVTASESIEDFTYRIAPLWRIPFKIKFHNDKIVKMLDELTEYIFQNEIEIEKLKEYSSKVIKLTSDESIGDERNLLLSQLYYNNDCLEWSKNLILNCFSNPNLKHMEEYILMKCLIMHQLGISNNNISTYLEALEDCKKAVEKYPNDARFYYMYGVIIGRGIQSHMEDEFTIDSVVDKFDKAYEISDKKGENNIFKATILNNIAYSITLKEDLKIEDLNIAVDAIKKMDALVPENYRDANFFDTKGIIFYYKAKLTSNNNQKKEFLEKSKKFLQDAKEFSKKQGLLKYEIQNIDEHLKNTDDFIMKINMRT